jgi:hypothetical protein
MDPEKIEQRIISGKGLLKASLSKRYKLLWLDFQVIRFPKQDYLNKNWNPARSKYAFVTLCLGNSVVDCLAVEFPVQRRYERYSLTEQNLYAIKCAHEAIQISIADFMGQLKSAPMFAYLNPESVSDRAARIAGWQYSNIYPDTVRVNCYADTALQVSLWGIPFDTCSGDNTVPPPVPPPQPPTQTYPPGTPVPVSPPYTPPDDGGDTQPYPGDSAPPPGPSFPYGDANHTYSVQFDVDVSNNNGSLGTKTGHLPITGTGYLQGPVQGYQILQPGPGELDQKIIWNGGPSGQYSLTWQYPDEYGGLYNQGWKYANVRNIQIFEH